MHLLYRAAFVVAADARGAVGIEILAQNGRCVAVDELAGVLGDEQLVEHAIVRADDADVVHKLAQTQNILAQDRLLHLLGVDHRARVFKGCRGDARGEHILDVQRGVLRRLHHVVQTRNAADVDDLVRVGDDGRAAVRHQKAADLLGCNVGRLNVDMAVDQAGGCVGTLGVDRLRSLIVADARDPSVAQRNVPLRDLAGINVDDAAVPDHRIGGDPAGRNVNEFFQFLPCHGIQLLSLFTIARGTCLWIRKKTDFSKFGKWRKKTPERNALRQDFCAFFTNSGFPSFRSSIRRCRDCTHSRCRAVSRLRG